MPSKQNFVSKSSKALNLEIQSKMERESEQLKLINHLKAENTHLKLEKLKELKQNNVEYKKENEKDEFKIDKNNSQFSVMSQVGSSICTYIYIYI
jgi:hypothetical protein